MRLREVVAILEQIAPTRLAATWDNVGLLAGDPEQPIENVLLTIDYNAAVAEEAARRETNLVIAYHPPLFKGVKRLVAGDLVFDAIRKNIAIYSPHTALDVADGGTNDVLADALGLVERMPLRKIETKDSHYKLIVFVPPKHAASVRRAMFAAGAGHIGQYNSCSFGSLGTATFFGEEGTNPTVGKSGRLEEVEELRIETVVSIHAVNAVLQAMRSAHPYEEPAFDLLRTAASPDLRGLGRIGNMGPISRVAVVDGIKRALSVEKLLVAGPLDGEVTRGAVCAGSCGDLVEDAISEGAQLYLTGELKHHDALRAADKGMTVVCALHSSSERAVLKRLKQQLEARSNGLSIHVSERDREPFAFQ